MIDSAAVICILFNHEGPMRGETFVTRKITRAVAAINTACKSAFAFSSASLANWSSPTSDGRLHGGAKVSMRSAMRRPVGSSASA